MEKASKAELKKIRELMRDRESRDKEGLFVAEGLKIIKGIISKGYELSSIIVSSNFAGRKENKEFFQEIKTKSIPILKVDNGDFDSLSSLQHSQGVLAIVKKIKAAKEIILDKKTLLVLCDGIQDPGNLGAIIRTSVAFGARAILVTGETVDVYNPKVIRASSGMLVDLPIHECDVKRLASLKKQSCRILVSQSGRDKAKDISNIEDLQGPVIVAFGSEGEGVSAEVKKEADDFFYIPISKKAESLNVSAAAAISLYVLSSLTLGRSKDLPRVIK